MRAPYKSFEDRGIHVGFRAPLLRTVRCRQSRERGTSYEALVSNWAGGGGSGDLVMDFVNLPEWCAIEAHDRALFDRLADRRFTLGGYLDPLVMREVRLGADSLASDPDIRAAAEAETAKTKGDAELSFLEILAMFGRHIAGSGEHGVLANLSRQVLMVMAAQDATELDRLVRKLADRISERVAVSRQMLRERLAAVSELATPICSLVTDEEDRAVGFLSRQHLLLEQMHDDLARQGGLDGVADSAADICHNLGAFLVHANAIARLLRDGILNFDAYVDERSYQRLVESIIEQRRQISYCLDGWADHALRWFAIAPGNGEARSHFVLDLARGMPRPPMAVKAINSPYSRGLGLSDLNGRRGRSVKALHSWADNELDSELQQRIAEGKRTGQAPNTVPVHGGDGVRAVHVDALLNGKTSDGED